MITTDERWYRLFLTGAVTAVVDGLCSSVVTTAAFGSTPERMFQSIAATLLGPSSYDGGARTAIIGSLMHVGVAYGWSAVFIFGVMRLRTVQRMLGSKRGTTAVGAAYGLFIWLFMSMFVIPSLIGRMPDFGFRWTVNLLVHIPFVGLPLVTVAARGLVRSDETSPLPQETPYSS